MIFAITQWLNLFMLAMPLQGAEPARETFSPASNSETSLETLSDDQQDGIQPTMLKASLLINQPVENLQGEKLGDVEDVVLDLDQYKIRYVAVKRPSVKKLGEKLFAIPWTSFQKHLQTDGKLTVDIDAEKLIRSPGFERTNWPNVGSRRWAEMVDIYYGLIIKKGDLKTNFGQKTKTLAEAINLVRLTKLQESSIQDENNRKFASVVEVIVELPSGKIPAMVSKLKQSKEDVTSKDATSEQQAKQLVMLPVTKLQSKYSEGKEHEAEKVGHGASYILFFDTKNYKIPPTAMFSSAELKSLDSKFIQKTLSAWSNAKQSSR